MFIIDADSPSTCFQTLRNRNPNAFCSLWRGKTLLMGNNKKRKEKNHKKKKRKATAEQNLALRYVHEWIFRDSPPASPAGDAPDDFAPQPSHKIVDPVVFELHCHSNHSDGFLSPSAVVERAHSNGVRLGTHAFTASSMNEICCVFWFKMNDFDCFRRVRCDLACKVDVLTIRFCFCF